MKETIPQCAYINAQILQSLNDIHAIQNLVKQVGQSLGVENYSFMNQAYIASLLYCLLVVPREVFVARNDSALDARLPSNTVTDFFKIERDTKGAAARSSNFLRRLRNSVAHARFSVDDQMVFRFTDRPAPRSTDEFIITASIQNLGDFLSVIGALLANLRTNPLVKVPRRKKTKS